MAHDKNDWIERMQEKLDEWQVKLDEMRADVEKEAAESDMSDDDLGERVDQFFNTVEDQWNELWDNR